MFFRSGDRVCLRSDNQYGASTENPAIGSRWACCGTVESDRAPYRVAWDNGVHNGGYRIEDLVAAIDGKNPPIEAPSSLFNWPGDERAAYELPNKRDAADMGERKLARRPKITRKRRVSK